MLAEPKQRNSTEKFKAVMAERDLALEKLRSATRRAERISDPPDPDTTKPYAAQRPKAAPAKK